MKELTSFTVNPVNREFHSHEKFLEQMSVLRVVGDTEHGEIKLIRSFVTVGTPGLSGFDPEETRDTFKNWKILDSMIEDEGVSGTFHTHPKQIFDFSDQDWLAIQGLARANGPKTLFHGVQAIDSTTAHFVSANMLNGQVIVCDLGWYELDVNDPVILIRGPVLYREWTRGSDKLIMIDCS